MRFPLKRLRADWASMAMPRTVLQALSYEMFPRKHVREPLAAATATGLELRGVSAETPPERLARGRDLPAVRARDEQPYQLRSIQP